MNSAEQVLLHTLSYITATLPVIIFTVFIMNMLTFSGYINRISRIARPLMNFGRMHESTGITFITAFGSPSAASTMLRTLHENGLISKKEVIIAVLSNAFPVMIMEGRSMLPVMLSFLGSTGLIIFAILLGTRFLQTLTALFIGRLIFSNSYTKTDRSFPDSEQYTGMILIKRSLSETLPLIKRIIKVTVPVTFIIFTLIEAGAFNYITLKIQFLSAVFKIPVEGLSIVAAYFGNYTAAFTVAGNLLAHGLMSQKDIIITMLTAKILASLFFAVRHSTPYYIGIFGSGLGMRITILNTLFRNCFDIGTVILLKFIL